MGIPHAQDPKLRRYAELVREKSGLLNLTAADSLQEILDRHIADGLAPLAWLQARYPGAPSLVDVGAGAGFIGLALKIAWPELRLTLLESRKGRCEFMEWASVKLGLDNVRVLRGRAEDVKDTFDIVTERALAPLDEATRLCQPLVKPGGVFLAWHDMPKEPVPVKDVIAYSLPGEQKTRAILCIS